MICFCPSAWKRRWNGRERSENVPESKSLKRHLEHRFVLESQLQSVFTSLCLCWRGATDTNRPMMMKMRLKHSAQGMKLHRPSPPLSTVAFSRSDRVAANFLIRLILRVWGVIPSCWSMSVGIIPVCKFTRCCRRTDDRCVKSDRWSEEHGPTTLTRFTYDEHTAKTMFIKDGQYCLNLYNTHRKKTVYVQYHS